MLSALSLAEAAVFERALEQCLAALAEPGIEGLRLGPPTS
jgi:hypothetical protein